MKSDLNDLKKLTMELMQNDNYKDVQEKNEHLIQKIYNDQIRPTSTASKRGSFGPISSHSTNEPFN